MHHEFTETTGHIMADPFNGMNISHRSTPNPFAGFRIVPGRVEGFRNHRPDRTMGPGGATKRMVMPEDTPDIRIHPESLTDIFDGQNIANRVVML
jgi:hypothetical protein